MTVYEETRLNQMLYARRLRAKLYEMCYEAGKSNFLMGILREENNMEQEDDRAEWFRGWDDAEAEAR